MSNKLFSLIVIPDSGEEVKSGSFNFKLILGSMAGLFMLFLICLFFIVGYHIKLNQEKSYKQAVVKNKMLVSRIQSNRSLYSILNDRLYRIQNNDKAFRNFNRMDVLDDDMYKAGIGGQVIVKNDYASLGANLAIDLSGLEIGITSLANRTGVIENSFDEVKNAVRRNRDIYNNTPSLLPTHSFRFTSYYAWRTHPISKRRQFHAAIDVAGHRGQKIFATADGYVTSASWQGPLGRCVKIRHKYGYETVYGHLDKISIAVGDSVKKGDMIGTMGSSGASTGVHVHYAVHLNSKPVNPMDYFR